MTVDAPQRPLPAKRVISLLPSAAEVVAIIGAEKLLVGRSHEDDFPQTITHLPILTAPKTTFTTSLDVDIQVSKSLSENQSLYDLDGDLLTSLKPDVIVTQDLCNVCAIDLVSVQRLAKKLNPEPVVITLNPTKLEDVMDDIITIGEALGMQEEAKEAKQKIDRRIQVVREFGARKVEEADGVRKRVMFMEWTEPIYPGGHWTPQIIHYAGGSHPIAPPRNGEGAGLSVRATPESVIATEPELLIIAPCGLDLAATRREADLIKQTAWWKELMKTVKRVVLVDGNQMFNRPGPRLVDALEFVAGVLWDEPNMIPEGFPWEEYEP
ncbi:hypothetical protein HDV05_001172 [Chytridiales sp. JEL 0842]|nr:hypothetical protein HDV05_001172 [Chytridiales sp. JEL 0842]